jgi:hypothetical protein
MLLKVNISNAKIPRIIINVFMFQNIYIPLLYTVFGIPEPLPKKNFRKYTNTFLHIDPFYGKISAPIGVLSFGKTT